MDRRIVPEAFKLTAPELEVMNDQGFLLAKRSISKKIHLLLQETKLSLQQQMSAGQASLPEAFMSDQGKISKGENYHGLPYQMLDFPAIFSKESIFAFRTMFWWGNFFSVTLHLQGEALKKYRKNICAHINELSSEGFFVSTGPTPWEYHYESENYKLIDIEDVARLAQENFIKLSKKIELENWAQLPFFAASQFQMLMQLAIS